MSDGSQWRDWAGNAAGHIRQQREERALREQLLVNEEKIKGRESPNTWAIIRDHIQQMYKALNEEMGSEILAWDSSRSSEAVVRVVENGKTARATFNYERLCLLLETPAGNDTYVFAVRDGVAVATLDGVVRQPHEIAKRFMDSLVKLIS